jgi:redox-sensing transcriptional repressor
VKEVTDSGGSATPINPSEDQRVSERTIGRMRWYLYALDEFAARGSTVVSSYEIAEKVGVKPGLVRKDLCQFGAFGRPSVGYNVAYLQTKLREILRLNEARRIAWVGVRWLIDDPDVLAHFAESNCEIVAVFDGDPSRQGAKIGDLEVLESTAIAQTTQEMGIQAAVIATPAKDAQAAADTLVAGGVRAILNLTPTIIIVPEGIAARNVDPVGELLLLSYSAGESSTQ